MNRVVVNVMDELGEITIALNPFAFKVIHEQGPPALILLIVSFSIAIKKVAELLHGKLRIGKIGFNQRFVRMQRLGVAKEGILAAHPNQKVEMVGHEAVGKSLADGINVLGIFFQEIAVVVIAIEEVLSADSVVVEVVVLIGV